MCFWIVINTDHTTNGNCYSSRFLNFITTDVAAIIITEFIRTPIIDSDRFYRLPLLLTGLYDHYHTAVAFFYLSNLPFFFFFLSVVLISHQFTVMDWLWQTLRMGQKGKKRSEFPLPIILDNSFRISASAGSYAAFLSLFSFFVSW